jgi:AmmeMemoRadiSam system protein B
MVPHAGDIYSGAIAGETFAAVTAPARALCIGPNHSGRGRNLALFPGPGYALPGGRLASDPALSALLHDRARLSWDREAHAREHSIEVQLPFLRLMNPSVIVTALCLKRISLAECKALGETIAAVCRELESPPLIVASSDMSHYLPAAEARRLDELALERVVALDPDGLFETVVGREISMCGFIPTTVMLFAARAMGARRAALVRYGNSGERSGDDRQVVGYAGVVVS